MNKEKAEKLKVEIIERRNYFKQLEHPLIYSKQQLHSGMYGRTVRREDREYMRDVKKRRGMSDTNLKTINKYLVNLAAYKNRSMSVAEAQVIDGGNGTEAPIVPEIFAPMAPKIKLTPKLQMRRQVRRGVGGY